MEQTKQLILCNFEPKDTNEYIKSKVNICAENMFEKFKEYQYELNEKKNLLEERVLAHNVKLELLEKTHLSFQNELQTICEKLIDDITSLKKYKDYLDKSNFKKQIIEINVFNSRVNDIITSIQTRLDCIESKHSVDEKNNEKIKKLEYKFNQQNNKLKELENKLLQKNTEEKDVFEEILNDKYNKLMNEIKINNDKNIKVDLKLNHIIDEINRLKKNNKIKDHDTKFNKIFNEINTIKKFINEDLMENKIKDKIQFISDNIKNHIKDNGVIKTELNNFYKNNEIKYQKMINDAIKTNINEDDKNELKLRISNLEQQMICQMTTIHNMSYNVMSNYVNS